jgi:CRP-like cAMP-binding protein
MLSAATQSTDADNVRPNGYHDSPRFMMSPIHPWRRAWDLAALLFTVLTVLLLPLQFAFETEIGNNGVALSLSALADVFFLCDLGVQFRTGSLDGRGNADLNPWRAALRYVRSWFVPDLLAAAFPLDLVGLVVLMGSNGTGNKQSSALQSFRTLRVLRLPKLLRIVRLIAARGGIDMNTMIDPSIITLIKFFFFQCVFWHWSGLFWWVIGGEGMVDDGFGPSPALRNASVVSKYSYSLYWTIAITSKVREPMPEARDYPAEITVFANLVITIGLIMQALLVGSASSVVQNIDSAAADYNRRLTRIRSYLGYRGVPAKLRARILFYYRFMWSSTGAMDSEEILPGLPAPLRAQMDILLTRSVFISIPVFQACEPAEIMQMVQGLVSHLALPGDVLVQEGKLSRGLYFIMRGAVAIMGPRPTITNAQHRDIKEKFDAFDADGSGSIDAAELAEAMRAFDLELSKAEAKRLIMDIDADGSGNIEFDEFLDMLLSHARFREAMGMPVIDVVEMNEGFFGEESVLTGFPSTETVRATKYSDFFLLPTAVFNKVRETNEAMGKLVHEYSQNRARQKALEKAAQPRRVLGRSATKRWRTLGGDAHPQQSV